MAKQRFIKSVIEASKAEVIDLPWAKKPGEKPVPAKQDSKAA